VSWAPSLPAAAASRRERLRRERTAAQLRRHARLEAEVAEQLEPLLGPAGRPVGDAATALWRRRRVDAYLALPPWRRAWRTWVSWGWAQRAVVALAAAALWTVICLPLRMLGLASLEASQAGVAVLAAAAPLAALVPPRRRGRFAAPLPAAAAPPWRGSRRAALALRLGLCAAVVAVAAVALLAVIGPGSPQAPPEGRMTPAHRVADAAAARDAVAGACGAAPSRVAPAGEDRWTALLPGGGTATVAIVPGAGFDDGGARARVLAGPPGCGLP
jgi:hypothetical protein